MKARLFFLGFCFLFLACSTPPQVNATSERTNPGKVQEGMASWYGKRYHGRATASGATYNMNAMTAAHRTLPFGTRVRVTLKSSGKSVVVTINDRGPFTKDRILDLSKKAAAQLGVLKKGQAAIRLEVLP